MPSANSSGAASDFAVVREEETATAPIRSRTQYEGLNLTRVDSARWCSGWIDSCSWQAKLAEAELARLQALLAEHGRG